MSRFAPPQMVSRSDSKGPDPRELARVEGGQRFHLFVQFPPYRPRYRFERLDVHTTASDAPGAGDGAIDQEDRNGMRSPRAENDRPVPLGHDLGPARMDHQQRLEGLQEPHGRGRVRVWHKGAREVEQDATGLVAKATEAQPLDHRKHRRGRQAGPARDIGQPGGPKAAEVAANQQLDPLGFCGLARAHPFLSQAVQVRARALPGPRRRHADHVEPQAQPGPRDGGDSFRGQERFQLGGAGRAALELLTPDGRDSLHVEAMQLVPDDAQPPFAPSRSDSSQQDGIVRLRHRMDRAAHQSALDRISIHERVRKCGASEISQSRPQTDVAGRRVLRLQAADGLERARQRKWGSLEQQLAREQGPIELARGEDALFQRTLSGGEEHPGPDRLRIAVGGQVDASLTARVVLPHFEVDPLAALALEIDQADQGLNSARRCVKGNSTRYRLTRHKAAVEDLGPGAAPIAHLGCAQRAHERAGGFHRQQKNGITIRYSGYAFFRPATSRRRVSNPSDRSAGVIRATGGLGERMSLAAAGRHSMSAMKRAFDSAIGDRPVRRLPPIITASSNRSRPGGTFSSLSPTRSPNGRDRRKTCLRPGALTLPLDSFMTGRPRYQTSLYAVSRYG